MNSCLYQTKDFDLAGRGKLRFKPLTLGLIALIKVFKKVGGANERI
tara:strand:- start:382 stop:519 length:138 start_codon:yes stop_codon:yes gene_type:complete